MPESFQKEKPPARINLFLEVLKGDAKKKMELPLRLLAIGDYSQSGSATPLAEREKININKDNFSAGDEVDEPQPGSGRAGPPPRRRR